MSTPRLAFLTVLSLVAAPAAGQIVDIASSPPDPFVLGAQANYSSEHYGGQAFSDDGRYVVFDTVADNLVAGDDNRNYDTFLRDRNTGALTLVSRRADGRPGFGASYESSISGDGRFVAFSSEADDLVAGDDNGESDIFVFDRTTGVVERVSQSSSQQQGDDRSTLPVLSRDGRYVAFLSSAANLVPGDTNSADDAFVRDRQLGLTFRVSVGTGNVQGGDDATSVDVDASGRFLCFVSRASNLVPDDTNARRDVFVHDLAQGTTTLVSRTPGGAPGNGDAQDCVIAADTGVVAFDSSATDLVPGDTNASRDVFVVEPGMALVSRIEAGAPGAFGARYPDISADGRHVVFESNAATLPGPQRSGAQQVYLHDRTSGVTTRLTLTTTGEAPAGSNGEAPRVASDGSAVLYTAASDDQVAGDTNRYDDVLVHVVATGVRERVAAPPVALPSGGGGTEPAISGDGRYIAFVSASRLLAPGVANGQQQIYLYDSVTRATTLISRTPLGAAAGNRSFGPRISADGRFIAWLSRAGDLVADPDVHGFENVFLHDRVTESTIRVTTAADANGANANCQHLAMSADGSRLAFVTAATNLIQGPTVFPPRLLVYTRTAGTLARADVGAGGELPNAWVQERPGFSADGRYLAFSHHANSFGVADPNPYPDAFRKDLVTGELLLVSRRSDGGAANHQSDEVAISGDGRWVAYRSLATNLVDGDDNGVPDIFRTDVVTGTTVRVTDRLRGPSNAQQNRPRISFDGRQVAFESSAALIPGDTNARTDIYVQDMGTGILRRASVGLNGQEYASSLFHAELSSDGAWLSFSMTPSYAQVAGRYNAPVGADAFKARNPVAEILFGDQFE